MARGKLNKGERTKSDNPPGEKGDCIDCAACVNVCPMGIDIRDGQQMECITCALCIDACDDVMDRIGKPRGLIDYMALKDEAAERSGAAPIPVLRHVLRPRTLMYFALWSLIGAGLVAALMMRSPFDVNVSAVRNPLFVTLSDGAVRNTYEVRLRNKQGRQSDYALGLDGAAPGLALAVGGQPDARVSVAPDQTRSLRVYVTAPAASAVAAGGRQDLTITVTDEADARPVRTKTVFHGAQEGQR